MEDGCEVGHDPLRLLIQRTVFDLVGRRVDGDLAGDVEHVPHCNCLAVRADGRGSLRSIDDFFFHTRWVLLGKCRQPKASVDRP